MPERDARPTVVIPADAEFEGTLVLPRPARIDGRVRGHVLAESDVWVGESGFVGADLAADRIVVAGTVEGDVHARTSIELHATGRVRGGLTAPTLRLAEGAVVDGECRSGRRAAEDPDSGRGSA
ncbi:MAG TPA: polymer-forming cytoskeletal protein [Myxococcota bacterium]|nr:polymer-forming cytoskeletal protein [Myxococcota bacterium]